MSTASLRATAMIARRRPRRFAMPRPQTRMAEYLWIAREKCEKRPPEQPDFAIAEVKK
jgi:hypothetical protein